ncbi:unnamed protein product [Triticum turgidum subsp. durum]|uniref:Uncharacterized protein n=1 Tax=Triticum turgidum subsp. durum TaxID=4567 RepID=A0A9R0U0K3_TRITD|nr:unnamed protein product [Triticum turgidum subsp. durum]
MISSSGALASPEDRRGESRGAEASDGYGGAERWCIALHCISRRNKQELLQYIMLGLDGCCGVTREGEGGLDLGLSCSKHCYLRRF